MARYCSRQDLVQPQDYGVHQISAKQALTPLDMAMPRLYMRWILCFPLSADADKIQIFEDLKIGLAHTISAISWIGGNVGPEEGSNPDHHRIQILDESSGVIFKFNDLTAKSGDFPTYAELEAAHFPLSELSEVELCPVDRIPPEDRPPAMAAQLNVIGGGVLLAVCAHHAVCDATSLATVLDTWAQMTSHSQAGLIYSRIDAKINDREQLMCGVSGGKLEDFPEYTLAPCSPATNPDASSAQESTTPFKRPEMTARIFRISKPSLVSLKSAAAAYSINDALQAIFWQHITLARRSTMSRKQCSIQATRLQYAANMRSRTSPPLSPQYTGNASIGIHTTAISFNEMAKPDSLITAAATIRDSVRKLSLSQSFEKRIGLLASRPDPREFHSTLDAFGGPDMLATSWADLGVYDMEWRGLGQPAAFRIPRGAGDGAMIVFPRLRDEALEVVVFLECQVMEKLMGDKEFGRYVSVVG